MVFDQDIAASFRERQLRCTPQRYAVLQYLSSKRVHATADEIFQAVNQVDPRSSRATVYNSLHALIEAGLVREMPLEGNAARFDANIEHHHHFVCERCGNVEDVEWSAVPGVEWRSALSGRKVRDYEIVFRGACSACLGAEGRQGA